MKTTMLTLGWQTTLNVDGNKEKDEDIYFILLHTFLYICYHTDNDDNDDDILMGVCFPWLDLISMFIYHSQPETFLVIFPWGWWWWWSPRLMHRTRIKIFAFNLEWGKLIISSFSWKVLKRKQHAAPFLSLFNKISSRCWAVGEILYSTWLCIHFSRRGRKIVNLPWITMLQHHSSIEFFRKDLAIVVFRFSPFYAQTNTGCLPTVSPSIEMQI